MMIPKTSATKITMYTSPITSALPISNRNGRFPLLQSKPCHFPILRKPIVTTAPGARPKLCASALAGAAPVPLDLSYSQLQEEKSPATLPTPPLSSTLVDVMPYLGKLALGDPQLRWRISLALMLLVISKSAGMGCPLLFKQAVDSLSTNAAGAIQGAMMAVALYGACDIIKHLAKEVQAPIFTPVSQSAARRVAYHTFAHVLDLDVRFHLDRRTGRLSRILERGTRSIQYLYRAVIFTFLPTVIELVAVCALLANAFSPFVAAAVSVTFAAYVGWTLKMTQMATEVRKRVNDLDNLTTSKAVDALLNYETVTLFNNQRLEVGQYDTYLKEFQTESLRTDGLAALLNSGQATILAAGLAGVMMTAIRTSTRVGGVTAGDLVMIQGLLIQLWNPLQYLGWFYRELRSSLVDMEDFFAILRTESAIKDGPITKLPPLAHQHHHTAAGANGHVANGNGNGASSNGSGRSNGRGAVGEDSAPSTSGNMGLQVALENVRFQYTAERQILNGVSISVAPGQSLAVVGNSGSGKSTVLKLLMRLYDVSEGSVQLNGVDVRQLTKTALRDPVAVVPQDAVLFYDTIMQNIRYGRPEASDEEVMEAARMARLDDAVAKMPDGYKTLVGERGLKLSGGEKQRVAIARAFLRQPRLLICDEATSALDSETEAQIMDSLAELAQGRTAVFVAHRLSTIKGCDKIVVLKDGVVVEEGSHEALLQLGGQYAAMWERQAAEEAQKQKQKLLGLEPGTSSALSDSVMRTLDGEDVLQQEEARAWGAAVKAAQAQVPVGAAPK